jgi:iron-sulfur cluster repair protein YtfE (RIC family)
MALLASDPVRRLEHSHVHLTKLAVEIRDLVRAEGADEEASVAARAQLVEHLEVLRDELLQHFANEEEGLFPFLRSQVPAKSEAVDRLESANATVCGSLVRLAHLAAQDRQALDAHRPALLAQYERFEAAYTEHSREEGGLFEELSRTLDPAQRAQLTEILRGL